MFEPEAKSILWGVSPMFLIVGACYHVISLGAPHWLANGTSHWGLWYHCPEDGECEGITARLNDIDHSWYRAVQGLEISATVFVLAAVVTGLMRVNLGHRIWQTACGLCAVVAGVFGVCGVIVYGRNFRTIQDQELSWAFMFNAASSGLCFVSGPLLILDATLHRHSSH